VASPAPLQDDIGFQVSFTDYQVAIAPDKWPAIASTPNTQVASAPIASMNIATSAA
jgi:hypothetical protein